jgi:F-type H+-transporting ATPase subunit gamma
MANLKDIRNRIDSTKNTQQITKAMKLVSAAKLRRAQNQIQNMRPYAQTLLKVIADVVATNRVSHALLSPHAETKKVLLVVLTSDRGLCGGFNSQINKFALNYYRENKPSLSQVDFLFLGRRGSDFLGRFGIKGKETILRMDKDISYSMAAGIADRLMKNYLAGDYDEIRLVYNEFKSAISQKVVAETMLPVDMTKQTFDGAEGLPFAKDMIYEPTPEVIIDQLLLKHFTVQVYRAMCESIAAEHGARMTAMENASTNAKEMISKLTLTYNKARQEKITTELIEIVSGAEALK